GRDVSAPVAAEVEVVANENELRVQDLDEETADELVGIDRRKPAREMLDDREVGAFGGNRAQTIGQRHDPERSSFGTNDGNRMRLEREDDGAGTAPGRFGAKSFENDLMPAMDAVEVSDRDDRAAQEPAGTLETAEDLHPEGVARGAILRSR